MLTNKQERIHIEGDLTVEHLMPQRWIANWPLPDDSKGMDMMEMLEADPQDPRLAATRRRNSALQTFGNLTIITQPLNSSVSNSAWSVKKPALLNSSLLPINLCLVAIDEWNEESIEARGKSLLDHAVRIWPRL